MKCKLLIVTYCPSIKGGVVEAANQVLSQFPESKRFVALRFYKPIWKQVGFTLLSYLRFLALLLWHRPKVVMIHVASKGDIFRNLFYVVAARSLGRKAVVQFHTNRAAFFQGVSPLLIATVSRFLRLANAYCFLSDGLRSEMKHDIDLAHAIVIPNAVPDEYLNQKQRYSLNQRTLSVVFFGRWTEKKGANEISDVMPRIYQKKGIVCHCYGYMPKESNIPGILFGPWIKGEFKMEAMSKAMAVILPSHAEAYPVTLLEAAACGTPFVVSDVGGCSDIVNASGAGVLVAVGDASMLEAEIESLFEDVRKWSELSKNGREWAESQSVEHICREWASFFKTLGISMTNGVECGA